MWHKKLSHLNFRAINPFSKEEPCKRSFQKQNSQKMIFVMPVKKETSMKASFMSNTESSIDESITVATIIGFILVQHKNNNCQVISHHDLKQYCLVILHDFTISLESIGPFYFTQKMRQVSSSSIISKLLTVIQSGMSRKSGAIMVLSSRTP